jgi:hypothetical protein
VHLQANDDAFTQADDAASIQADAAAMNKYEFYQLLIRISWA